MVPVIVVEDEPLEKPWNLESLRLLLSDHADEGVEDVGPRAAHSG